MFKDCDLVLLNKDSKYYASKGLHKGMEGIIICDRCVNNRWLVEFFCGDMIEVDGLWYSQNIECDVKEEDLDFSPDNDKCRHAFRITDEDLLKPEHRPLGLLFNALPENEIPSRIEDLSEGHGVEYDNRGVFFLNNLPQSLEGCYDHKEGMVAASCFEKNVLLNYDEMLYYIKLVATKYMALHPESTDKVRKYSYAFAERFCK